MKRGTFLILVMMIGGLGLVIRSFFGGSSNKTQITESPIPQSTDTGFVNNLTNTGNTQEPTTSTNTQQTDTPQKDYTEIRLIMPRYFYTPERKTFKKDLYDEEKVHINFIFVDDLNSYRDDLSNKNFSDADIFLFPYDRSELVDAQTFAFQKSLKPAFDDFVSPIIQDQDTSFLPFAADPMIMYILSGYTLNSFSETSKFADNRESQKPMSFPIFFGITDEDYYNKGFSREYKDILRYSLIHYFTTYRNINNEEMLSNRIDSNNLTDGSTESQNYNVSNLNTILTKIDIPECKYFPSICFQLYDLVGLRFGFLSDTDIVETYFQAKQSKFTEIQKKNFPFYETEAPVRIRGWSIPNSLTDINTINAVYRFLGKYMNSHNKYNLLNSTLPVFKSEEGKSIIDNSFIGFRGYILTTGGNFIEKLKSTRAFWQLLDYEISTTEYLKRA